MLGILIERKNKQKDNNVIPNRSVAVTFTDVNGSKIETKNFTTNEFGSFNGSFVIPEGLLTGNMQITTENGSTSISVEEYKRPKFFVEFDTLKKDYALNDDVTVTGKASAYAGNNVDGAEVKYRVARTYYFPYYWASYYYRSFYPQTSEMEIANGTTKTDAQGNFEIDFKAIPDLSIDPKALPVFTYTVTADVTDINGETRSSSKVVRVGYTSLNITASIPSTISEENVDKINIQTQNLNGDFVAADVTIKISKLKMPSTVLRKRLWEMPDQFVMDSISFKKDFPNDVYKNEDEKENWAIEKKVLERTIRTTKVGNVTIDKNSWKDDGWYVVELKTKDKNGKEIVEKKYTQSLQDETNEPLVLVNKKEVLQPGETADVKLISGYDNLHLIRVVDDMNQSRNTDVLTYDGNPITWTRKITEADRGGVMVSYITVKENRVYTRQALINVPWSNKDLNISWETHRDKLQPGAEETWTMVVSGDKKEKVAAEMVATLYDASLDAFREHRWSIYDLFPRLNSYTYWNSNAGFGQHAGNSFNNIKQEDIANYDKRYDALNYVPYGGYGRHRAVSLGGARSNGNMYTIDEVQASAKKESSAMAEQSAADVVANEELKEVALQEPPPIAPTSSISSSSENIQVRKNLQETAFFSPQLKTDAEGNILITFTMPEALTEWKMMAFAHTKDMKYGFLNGAVKTQKRFDGDA